MAKLKRKSKRGARRSSVSVERSNGFGGVRKITSGLAALFFSSLGGSLSNPASNSSSNSPNNTASNDGFGLDLRDFNDDFDFIHAD
jgi:hypothetical protein